MLKPEAAAYFITTVAAAIADNRKSDEIDVLAALFTQLGDTLASISAVRAKQEEKSSDKSNDTSNDKSGKKSNDKSDKASDKSDDGANGNALK